jgi:hypothetical protein
MNLAKHAALAGHRLCLEDGPEVVDPEPQEDQGEELDNMYPPGCTSSDQASLTDEQGEELRRRAKAPSWIRNGRRPGYSVGGEVSRPGPAMFELVEIHQRDYFEWLT